MKETANRRRCVICAAGPTARAEELRPLLRSDDWVIAADGGLALARSLGVTPSVLVADFDSADREDAESLSAAVVELPVHKDDTDTMAAARIALEKGCGEVLILGGTGGRLDHTMANLAVLLYLKRRGVRAVLADEHVRAEMLLPGRHRIEPAEGWKFSLFAYGGSVSGLFLKNAEYPLENAVLTPDFPLGISNEFGDKTVELRFEQGILLFFLSKD